MPSWNNNRNAKLNGNATPSSNADAIQAESHPNCNPKFNYFVAQSSNDNAGTGNGTRIAADSFNQVGDENYDDQG
jgi:hypothetical protein